MGYSIIRRYEIKYARMVQIEFPKNEKNKGVRKAAAESLKRTRRFYNKYK